jgi:hypothetical protein
VEILEGVEGFEGRGFSRAEKTGSIAATRRKNAAHGVSRG